MNFFNIFTFLLCYHLATAKSEGFVEVSENSRDDILLHILNELKSLKDELKSLDEKVDRIEEKVDRIDEKVDRKFDDVNKNLIEGFSRIHSFGRDRISTLRKATHRLNLPNFCNGSLTRHTVYFGGLLAEVFSPHFDCSSDFDLENILLNVITHDHYDLALITGCPTTEYAINITNLADPQLGDSVVSFGYGETAKAWSGTISDVEHPGELEQVVHWQGGTNAKVSFIEYIAQSAQHFGMSGAAVVNGCGYLGMTHIVLQSGSANFAAIVPGFVIADLMLEHAYRLSNVSQCTSLKIVDIPVMPFIECGYKNI